MPAVQRLKVVLVLVALIAAGCGGTEAGGPVVARPASEASAVASGPPSASGSPSPSASASASSSPSAALGSPSPALADVPIVPVVDFRSTETMVRRLDIQAALAGGGRYSTLELVASDADAILTSLGLSRPPGGPSTRLVTAANAAALTRDLAAHRDRLGFIRAADVGPGVRALGFGGRSLFGVDRVTSLADWPLTARLVPAGTFDPAAIWTLVAAGDVMLDRGVARQVKILGKGVDFPFAGGAADITSRYCCSSFGWRLPRAKRAGDAGAIRHLIEAAELAAANFENPAPDRFRYHVHGTVFSADPRLIDGLRNAGIDWVSLGNNHIRDAGGAGVLQTIANLDERGIAHSGAGKNTAAAREAAILDAGGVKVAFLAYDTIARYYAAGPDRIGSAQMSAAAVRADVAAARKAGADVVVVYPHWGVEYTTRVTSAQQSLGRAAIDAGADLVVGNHPHWVGAMEIYEGKPIWYALGNFVFDQSWSEPTQEGLVLELTFSGRDLVQAWLHPTIVLDQAQPNFLDPAGDGKVVLDQLYRASGKRLPW